MRPETIADIVQRSRDDPDWDFHLREFLDGFYKADGNLACQSAMITGDPGLTNDEKADAFLGGVAEHLARRWRLPIPGWVRQDCRYLTRPMFVPDDRPLKPFLMIASPVAFRTRLIFTGPDPLQRARFPYQRGVVAFSTSMPPDPSRPR